MIDPLISATALAAALDGDDPPVVIDVRWTLAGGDDRDAYERGHVPGAVFVSFDSAVCGPAGRHGRHPLADPAVLQSALRAAGIDDGDDIVVVDGGDLLAAARTWWTLRWAGIASVRVLDGGIAAWRHAVESGPGRAANPPGTVTVRPGSVPALDADAAAAQARTGELIDVRTAERYRGEVEPIDPVAGHIPGAVNVPDAVVVDGRMIDPHRVRELLAGIAEPAAYCGSGITAARMVLAGASAGIDVGLYVGSWSEWSADPQRPVATGATP